MKASLLFLIVVVLSGCSGVRRDSLYKWHSGVPWRVHVASLSEVTEVCSPLISLPGVVFGCTIPRTAELWTVDSAVVAAHECAHLRAFDSLAANMAWETTTDLLLGLTGINDLLLLLAGWVPAEERPCGPDYLYGADSESKWVRLPAAPSHSQ